jgi:hypothetical protein
MSKMTPIYNDTLEKQLNAMISKLDDKPKICTSPLEASSYLGITLMESEEGYQQKVESLYTEFTAYMDSFAKECIRTNNTQTVLKPTISRIISLYKSSEYTFTHSPLRMDWKNQAQYFFLPNPSNDFNIDKEIKYTREAYKFFHSVSSIQLYFIQKLQDDLTPYGSGNIITQTETKPEFFFSIQPEAKKHSFAILQYMHKRLKEEGYINCTLPQFRQVFMSQDPKPIVWLKEYIHLSYLIKHMGEKFLIAKSSPNNYDIAHKFFHNRQKGVSFEMANPNHDHDSKNKNAVKFFDGLISNSIDFHLSES